MNVNLKRGLLVGLAASAICTGLFVAFWYFTLPPDMRGSDHSVSRWWKGDHASATFLVAAVAFGSSGLIGFVMGAFRPTIVSDRHDNVAQDAAPNGGPATQFGNSGVSGGPPSVS